MITVMRTLLILTMAFTFSGCSPAFVHESASMSPTIPPGTRFAMDDKIYRSKQPTADDIVVVDMRSRGLMTVLRIIAVPGDEVILSSDALLVNHRPIYSPRGAHYGISDDLKRWVEVIYPLKLGDEQYFAVGDNPNEAWDSRFFGPVTSREILGKVKGF